MQTVLSSRSVQATVTSNTAFADLPAVPAAPRVRRIARRRYSRSQLWHLASVLSLLGSSAAYVVYALLQMGA